MYNAPEPRSISAIICEIMEKEGARSKHDDDLGGDTAYGITEATARRLGFTGTMDELEATPELVYELYRSEYVDKPGFEEVWALSPIIGEEVIDTGVNMGQSIAAKFLQRWLNVYNNKQHYYSDLIVDGHVGPATINALKSYLDKRRSEGELVLWRSLNCSQGARYLDISEAREANESFTYGWMLNRVVLA